jgi:hypothetical protein
VVILYTVPYYLNTSYNMQPQSWLTENTAYALLSEKYAQLAEFHDQIVCPFYHISL